VFYTYTLFLKWTYYLLIFVDFIWDDNWEPDNTLIFMILPSGLSDIVFNYSRQGLSYMEFFCVYKRSSSPSDSVLFSSKNKHHNILSSFFDS
jgi:hypothetical protein